MPATRMFGSLLLAALALPLAASASPKGYDVERLLRDGMPGWRGAPATLPATTPKPLERLPNVPAPGILPQAPGIPPQATDSLPPAAGLTTPPPLPNDAVQYAPQPAPHQAPAAPIIHADRPRSTVSGAWTPRR